MGGAVFTPLQQNWQWFDDDGAEPTGSKAAENTTDTLGSWQEVCRLRVCINETGGKDNNNIVIDLEYSLNDADWFAFGPATHWDYYNGAATEGNLTTTYKLTDPPDAHGEYSESAGGSGTYDINASDVTEFDICIRHTTSATGDQIYYFRVKIDATEVPQDGATHPNLTTASKPVVAAVAASQKQFNRTGISTYGIGGLKL